MREGKRVTESYPDVIARLYPEMHWERNENGQSSLTKSITFQVTDACNLACTYCYQINKGKRRMSLDVAKKVVDLLLSGEKGVSNYLSPETSPALVLDFIGGEPLLEVELIDQVVDYFRSQAIQLEHPWAERFMISLCTNGVLYFDPKVQAFLEKHKHHLSLSVTLDGTKELHDSCRIFPDGRPSYDLALAAAEDWMGKDNYLGSKITIAPENLPFLNTAVRHMMSLGYEDINANVVYEKGWKPEHAVEFYRQLILCADDFLKDPTDNVACSLFCESFFHAQGETELQNWCGGTGQMLACDPDGWFYPCLRYMESSLGSDRPPMRIGNVWEGIGQCDKFADCIECLWKIDRRTQSTDECFYCPISAGCSWCSAYNYQETGTPNKRVTYICEMHKARSLANVYYWNEYYRTRGENKYFKMSCPEEWAIPIVGKEEYHRLQELEEAQRIRSIGDTQ